MAGAEVGDTGLAMLKMTEEHAEKGPGTVSSFSHRGADLSTATRGVRSAMPDQQRQPLQARLQVCGPRTRPRTAPTARRGSCRKPTVRKHETRCASLLTKELCTPPLRPTRG
jgi:hypothetical protein